MKRVKYENPEGAAPAQGLYSHAARVSAGDLLFVAGQLAVAPDGGVVGKNDFAAQFQCVFDNLGDVLEGLGAGWTDIAKFTTYLVHSQDLEQFMALRADLFPKLFGGDVFPPNTLLMVDRLVKEEFLIEVEAVVAVPGD
ncbi:MAG: translation initiation inhibitor [Rhodospirillaceae bacterium]|nr:translation initiation inhibitor [Rhodospirillaceae bacterium]|tara:strand:+ start:238 stop:654 length:417 start_codon:yes stop_codon:yes gene_type:complete